MTKANSPRSQTETATRRSSRQTEIKAPRRPRAASLARQIGGETPAHPLRGLFSAAELQQIDERCRAMGRNVVDVVVTALRQWVKPEELPEDSHLDNGQLPAPNANEDRFAALSIFGTEIARITNNYGELELMFLYCAHLHYVFEAITFFEDGEWRDMDYWHGTRGTDNGPQFVAFIRSLPAPHVRREFVYEKGYDLDDAVDWFDHYGIAIPEAMSRALEALEWRKWSQREEIAKEVLAAERARIARAMSAALAA
jgi:hypothetical protein